MPKPIDRPLTIWCNAAFPEPVMERLTREIGPHRLLLPPLLQVSNLNAGDTDPLLAEADVAFGQPDPHQIVEVDRLDWIHLTTAGYTRYDTLTVRDALLRRGARLTNSSTVYVEPCAQHALAIMLAMARQLPQIVVEQLTDRVWSQTEHRERCRLLVGQTAILYGYGAIASRLAQLLQPFKMNLIGVRRTPRGDEASYMASHAEADALLPTADHVINILPASEQTQLYFSAERFARMKPGALFYNIGRGATVDQTALLVALRDGPLAGAYLDVTDPEPLPPDHPLWFAPNCFITPHSAGGYIGEFDVLASHFVENLRRYEAGQVLRDIVI